MAGVRPLRVIRDGEPAPEPQVLIPPELLHVTDQLHDLGQVALAGAIVENYTHLQALLLHADDLINMPDAPA